MRRYQARFFPSPSRENDYIVVGHVVWEQPTDRPRVEPSPSLKQAAAPAAILAALRYIVHLTGSKSVERVASLTGRWWSFVEVQSPTGNVGG
jgi:hypothetical protein